MFLNFLNIVINIFIVFCIIYCIFKCFMNVSKVLLNSYVIKSNEVLTFLLDYEKYMLFLENRGF